MKRYNLNWALIEWCNVIVFYVHSQNHTTFRRTRNATFRKWRYSATRFTWFAGNKKSSQINCATIYGHARDWGVFFTRSLLRLFFTSRSTIMNVKLNCFSIDPKMWVSVTMLSHHCILVLIQPSTPYINTLATVIRIDAMTFLLPGPTNSNNIHSRGPSRTPGTYHKPNTINLKINMTLFRIKICSSISLHYTLQLFQHCGPTTMHEEFPFRVLGEGIILFYDTGTVRKGQFLLWFHSLQ